MKMIRQIPMESNNYSLDWQVSCDLCDNYKRQTQTWSQAFSGLRIHEAKKHNIKKENRFEQGSSYGLFMPY